MKKESKIIENNIEYLVIISDSYKYLNDCRCGHIKNSENIKIIIDDERNETFYFYKNMMHNLYGPAWTRLVCKEQYWIYGVKLEYEKWYYVKNYILRREKLEKINKVSKI